MASTHNDKPADVKREPIQFYPFQKYGDITLPPIPTITRDPELQMKSIREFDSRAKDVILCSPMKSGSNWCHEILSMLLGCNLEYNNYNLNLSNMESITDFESRANDRDPRLFHTHVPFNILPKKHVKNGYKIVYLNRNPKDRAVSQYLFLQGKAGVPVWTWDKFFENFVLKDDLYSGWFNYTKEFETAVKRKSANILPVTFEKLKMDPFTSIQKMAEFLEVPFTDSFIQDIGRKCEFDNLKKNKIDITVQLHPEGKSTLFRKGIIGDWKNWFTVAQNEKFDTVYHTEMKGIEVNYIFE